jgi:uncharacterized protein YggE
VGQLLDQAFKLGANTVDRVAFTLKDYEPAQTETLRAAAGKARARATALAAGLGLRLGPVVSATERREDMAPFELLGGLERPRPGGGELRHSSRGGHAPARRVVSPSCSRIAGSDE